MAIIAQDIVSRIQQVGLDAQPDTDYYSVQNEILPAIDSSVKWLMSVIQSARSKNKNTDEIVSELAQCLIFITSYQSRIQFDEIKDWWTIDAVVPLPKVASNNLPPPVPPINANPFASTLRNDFVFLYSNYSAKRKTIEEANENRNNPFSSGYLPSNVNQSLLIGGSDLNIDFSYLAPYIYNQDPSSPIAPFIEINPLIPNKECAVFVTKRPLPIISVNTSIPFPVTVFNVIYEKALQFLSYSQGDQTTIWEVTEQDIAKLINAVS